MDEMIRIVRKSLTLIVLLSFTLCSSADPIDDYIAVSLYLGGRISSDLTDNQTGEPAKVSDDFAQTLAFTWRHSRNKEGELLFSNASQNIQVPGENNSSAELNTTYLHFGGRALFTQPDSPFSSSVGLGIGAAFLIPDESKYDNEIALSGNISGGIRYQLNDKWALRSDLRIYGTVLNSNNSLFCGEGQCLVKLEGEVYVQTDLMAGVEYKF
ncbi:outer membrane beta-barrel protein [Psychromonas aquimarina]|uniref:outer membrane beta-barrel protein n=1 Tax=Psychromonas aquimarina TaxID=444919 RepID=UPI0004220D79|nr:outer membrane beta-barrel protein [Psychromonas aquimarina]